MRLEPGDITDLKPIITAVVVEVLDRVEADRQRLNGRLSYGESEAAGLLGIPRHSLRDARLRHEIAGSKIGKRILYSVDELQEFLRRNQI